MVLPKGSLKTGVTRFQAAFEFQAAYRLHKNKQREISRCLWGICLAVQTFHPNHHHRRGNGFLRFNFGNRRFDVLFNG